jgi:hypothetical protein
MRPARHRRLAYFSAAILALAAVLAAVSPGRDHVTGNGSRGWNSRLGDFPRGPPGHLG